jgi:hypothetical protein
MIYWAYGAVRTFEGRLDMLRKISTAYFSCADQNPEMAKLQEEIKVLVNKKCKGAGERRNEIAHGVVKQVINFADPAKRVIDFSNPNKTYWFGPSEIDSSKNVFWGEAYYAYTSKEINHYAKVFEDVAEEVHAKAMAVLGKPPPLWQKCP